METYSLKLKIGASRFNDIELNPKRFYRLLTSPRKKLFVHRDIQFHGLPLAIVFKYLRVFKSFSYFYYSSYAACGTVLADEYDIVCYASYLGMNIVYCLTSVDTREYYSSGYEKCRVESSKQALSYALKKMDNDDKEYYKTTIPQMIVDVAKAIPQLRAKILDFHKHSNLLHWTH